MSEINRDTAPADFIQLVRILRQNQKDYKRTREQVYLTNSLLLSQIVDEHLEEFNKQGL